MIIFNNNLPLALFKVQQVGSMVQYKPYASYYQWVDWFDLAPLDQSAAIAELTAAVEAAQADATAAGEAAATAYIAAADAQAYAEEVAEIAIDALNDAATAQATADAALAAAGGAVGYPRYHFFIPRMMKTVSGGWGAITVANTSPLNMVSLMTGDGSKASIVLPFLAGNWRINLNVIILPTGCTFEIRLDNVTYQVGENYNATNIPNQEIALDFTVGTTGMKLLEIVINGHPSGSTGYQLWCSFIALTYLS